MDIDHNFKDFPTIALPDEQLESPFHFVVTGSAGIKCWVASRHLQRYVFVLPLFSKVEGYNYVIRLAGALGKSVQNVADYLAVPPERISDTLEEHLAVCLDILLKASLE